MEFDQYGIKLYIENIIKQNIKKTECGGGIMFYVENEGFYGAGIRGRPPGSSKTE